jgi:transposase InsO family protein
MTKFLKSYTSGYKYPLPPGFHLVYDLVPFFRIADHFQKTNLSPGARKRLKWMDYYRHCRNASQTCRHFDIPRKTFYYWLKRYDPRNLSTLEDKDKTPHRKRQREITLLQEERIISLRKNNLRESKFNIAIYYQRKYGEKISSWKIQKVIEKYHLYYNPKKIARTRRKRQRALKKKRITELKKKKRSGFLIQVDTICIWWKGIKRYIITAIDVFSKIAFARVYKSPSSYNAADFLLRLNYLFQDRIENIQTDNGSEFAKYFERACQYLGIEHYFSRTRTPKDLSCLERFNRTLKEQFLPGHFTPDIPSTNRELTEWLIHNNFERPHQSLGYLTPIEFHQKHHKVLPMYPSRTFT